MKKKNGTLNILLAGAGAFLLCQGCVRNEWIVEDVRGDASGSRCVVYFNPRMESNFTRALTPFPAGCQAQIYAFIDGPGKQSVGSPVYESLKAGTLSPTGSPMTLPVGTYDFYAVSLKEDAPPPAFTDNSAGNLSNGVDYLWCGITGENINATGSTVDLTFRHCATQFVFDIVSQENATVISDILYAAMSVPDPAGGARWNLLTGEISQMNVVPEDIAYMNVSDVRISTVCLPFTNTEGENLLSVFAVSQADTMVSFEVDIPIPESGYLSGRSYQYEILFMADTILLGDVLVAPWIENLEGDINVP